MSEREYPQEHQPSRYGQDEVQEILKRAVRRQADPAAEKAAQAGSFSHEQLREMAAELGIEAEAADQAAQEWRAQQEAAGARRAQVRSLWRGFTAHLIPFLLVIGMLMAIHLMKEGWVAWPVFALLGLAIHRLVWKGRQCTAARWGRCGQVEGREQACGRRGPDQGSSGAAV